MDQTEAVTIAIPGSYLETAELIQQRMRRVGIDESTEHILGIAILYGLDDLLETYRGK